LFLRFEEADLEERYQRERLAEELAGGRALIAVAAVVNAALAWNDYTLFGPSSQLTALLLARGALVAASLALFVWLGSSGGRVQPDVTRSVIGAWAAALALQNLYVSLTRPPDSARPRWSPSCS
jgi:hypothetical protein